MHVAKKELEKSRGLIESTRLGYLVTCAEYLDALLEAGLEREYCAVEAIGMAWLDEDMPGLPQVERARRVEMVRSLLIYNICGDRLYMPFEGGEKRETRCEATGVRAGHFGGMAAANLLAFLANADARPHVERRHLGRQRPSKRERAAGLLHARRRGLPRGGCPSADWARSDAAPFKDQARKWFRQNYKDEYAVLSERMFNQRDIENYFSELASLAGYKPSQRMVEARARKVDFNNQWRHDESLGAAAASAAGPCTQRRGQGCSHASRPATRGPSWPTAHPAHGAFLIMSRHAHPVAARAALLVGAARDGARHARRHLALRRRTRRLLGGAAQLHRVGAAARGARRQGAPRRQVGALLLQVAAWVVGAPHFSSSLVYELYACVWYASYNTNVILKPRTPAI